MDTTRYSKTRFWWAMGIIWLLFITIEKIVQSYASFNSIGLGTRYDLFVLFPVLAILTIWGLYLEGLAEEAEETGETEEAEGYTTLHQKDSQHYANK